MTDSVTFVLSALGAYDVTGEDCLPFDGSVSPKCEEYVDPTTFEPVFIEHQWSKYIHTCTHYTPTQIRIRVLRNRIWIQTKLSLRIRI
jgi:hypothetical protein